MDLESQKRHQRQSHSASLLSKELSSVEVKPPEYLIKVDFHNCMLYLLLNSFCMFCCNDIQVLKVYKLILFCVRACVVCVSCVKPCEVSLGVTHLKLSLPDCMRLQVNRAIAVIYARKLLLALLATETANETSISSELAKCCTSENLPYILDLLSRLTSREVFKKVGDLKTVISCTHKVN